MRLTANLFLCACVLLCSANVIRVGCDKEHPHLNQMWNTLFGFTQPKAPPPHPSPDRVRRCLGCSNSLDEDEDPQLEKLVTALRIEYIKHQILKKLRLKEKPSVTMPITGLPRPVVEDETLFPRAQDDIVNDQNDDFYGKTTQAIIFPQEDEAKCTLKKRNPSACLPFQIPTDFDVSDVNLAELWIYKEPDKLDSHNQTFLVSEVAHWDTKRSFQKTKPIAMKETNVKEGWLRINVAWAVKNWLEYRDTNHVLNVACKTCAMDVNQSPISSKPDLKPFLVIYTYQQPPRRRHQRRIKRHLNCGKGVNQCCRESLYVSFEEIGWSNWILHPPGYNAYFCRGSCTAAASVTLSGSYHNSIVQKYLYGRNLSTNTKLELRPCCAPTQYKDLELLFINNNKTLTTKVLPNMIVDTCGCM